MTRQYQLPGAGYINAAEDGREYQIPGGGFFNDDTVGGGGGGSIVGPLIGNGHLMGRGPLIDGRLAA